MEITYDTMRALRPTMIGETRAGWISPSGDLILCGPLKHLESLPEEYRDQLRADIKQLNADIDEHSEWCAEHDEHPEWHRWPDASDLQREAYRKAYGDGYIRIAAFNSLLNGLIVEAEGLKSYCDRHADDLKEIAIMLGGKLRVGAHKG